MSDSNSPISLPKRLWEEVSVNAPSSPTAKKTSSPPPFTVMQFNMLASHLCDPKSFPHVEPKFTDRSYRLHLMENIFKQYQADLYCLEEVDEYKELQRIFSATKTEPTKDDSEGAKGCQSSPDTEDCAPSSQSPQYELIWRKKRSLFSKDGCCVVFNKARFRLIQEPIIKYYHHDEKKSHHNQLMLLVPLQDRLSADAKPLLLVCTHLKAKVGFEEIREAQVKQLLEEVRPFEEKGYSIVIGGDFNETMEQQAIQQMLSSNYTSVYPLHDSLWTTWKKRKHEVCRMIDYIFFRGGVQVKRFLKVMEKDEIPDRLPARNYPSDHVHLLVEFGYQ